MSNHQQLQHGEHDLAFEKLLEVDANDDVGRVVDMYFRRPASAHYGDGGGVQSAS